MDGARTVAPMPPRHDPAVLGQSHRVEGAAAAVAANAQHGRGCCRRQAALGEVRESNAGASRRGCRSWSGAKRRAVGAGAGGPYATLLILRPRSRSMRVGTLLQRETHVVHRILKIGAGILISGMKPMLVITMRIPWLLEASRPHIAPLHPAAITMESAHTAPQAMLAWRGVAWRGIGSRK